MERIKHPRRHPFGFTVEAFAYTFYLLVLLWLVQWAQYLFPQFRFAEFGVLPRRLEGLWGILFSPLIHARNDFAHIINNSLAIAVLLPVLIFYYREVSGRVFFGIYLASGLFLWSFAADEGSYHIGISGVIYGLTAFLFVSGVLRRYFPLQAISLFVVFAYGSMIWGIFPLKTGVSWQGHFMGLIAGVIFAFIYRKEGVQRPKFQYEIEQEMGIEPPDLEGMWLEKVRQAREAEELRERQTRGHYIVYDYIPETKPPDDSAAKP